MPIKVTISSPQAQRISVNDQQRTGVRQIGITSDASLASGTVKSIAIATTEGLNQSGSPITITGTITVSANLATTTQTGVVRLNDTLTAQNTTTALTANMGFYLDQKLVGKVQNTVSITTGNGLVGGGDLSTNRTITANDASLSVNGVVRLNDTLTSTNTGQALTANMGRYLDAKSVQNTRTISTTSPLAGGGDLTADRTLSIQAASTTQNGEVRLNDTLASANVGQALTANMGRYLDAKSVPNTRQILTAGGAISGGGDLTADRTLVIANASTSVNGVVRLNDSLTSQNTGQALTANMGFYIVQLEAGKVQNTFSITTGNGLVGGGDFTTNRTISANDASLSVNGVVRLNDTLASQNTGQALTANMGFWITSQLVGKVQNTRFINTTSPLFGGTTFDNNPSLTIGAASTSANGETRLNDTLTSPNTFQAATANVANILARPFIGTYNGLVSNNATNNPTGNGQYVLNAAGNWVAPGTGGGGGTGTVTSVTILTGSGLAQTGSSITTAGTYTIVANDASVSVNGVVRLNDSLTSTNTGQAATANIVRYLETKSVQNNRLISTTSPLTGGGDLTADRTLAIQAASTTQNGEVRLNDSLTSANVGQALTANMGRYLDAKSVPNTRQILTAGGAITGGGDLTADRTLVIANASLSVNGVVRLEDSLTSTNTGTAATANIVRYLDTYKVSNTDIFIGSTTRPGLVPANNAGNGMYLLSASGTWVAPGSGGGGGGSVTSVTVAGGNGLQSTGSPITISGTITVSANDASTSVNGVVRLNDTLTGANVGQALTANMGVFIQTSKLAANGYTNGQILIGNTQSTSLDKATLTTGIGLTSITAAGNLTVQMADVGSNTIKGRQIAGTGPVTDLAPTGAAYVVTRSDFIPITPLMDGSGFPSSRQSSGIAAYDARDAEPMANTYVGKGIWSDFKNRTTANTGFLSGPTFVGIVTFAPWSDDSGGNVHQLGFTSDGSGNVFYRSATRTSGYNNAAISWSKIWNANNDGDGSGLEADLLDGFHATAFIQNTRTIFTGNGLLGGGQLSANLTLVANDASTTVNGVVRLNDTLTSTNVGQAATANIVRYLDTYKVSNTRLISTTSPLTGGGDLTADRTLSIQAASTTQNGEVRLNDTLTSANVGQALTANMGRYLDAKSVPNTRQILTAGGAITGGGDLTADRTLVIANASLSVNGVVRLEDSLTSSNTGTAATANIVRYLDVYKVSNTRQIITTGGAITGGGTLQNDLTLVIANASLSVNGVVRLEDSLTSSNTGTAATANIVRYLDVYKVPNTRQIITTGGAITGGGTLQNDLTLVIANASTSVNGVVRLNDSLTGQNTGQALTANMGFYLAQLDGGKVPNTRQILTVGGAITGGGTLQNDLTLVIANASLSVNGVVRLEDSLTSTNTGTAATANIVRYLDTYKVSNTDIFIGSTTRPGLVPANNAGNGMYLLSSSGTWVAPGAGGGGGGSVTSVTVAGGNGLVSSGSPITISGVITLAANDASTSVNGVVRLEDSLTSTNTFTAPTSNIVRYLDVYKVSNTRTISTTSPLTGGGSLAADRTLAIQAASTTQNGEVRLNDSLTSSNNFQAATANIVRYLETKSVQNNRLISTTSPLTGGGDLTADRTLAIQAASTTQNGEVRLNDTLASQNVGQALTANMGFWISSQFVGKVQNTRTIATTSPLTGGGDLTADRTLAIQAASTTQNGEVRLNDTLTSTNVGQAATANIVRYLDTYKVSNTRLISTTSPLTGGGDLTADRTLAIQAASTTQNGEVRLNDSLSSANIGQALTANMGRYLDAKSVPNTRQILTAGGAITGGGDLTADRTLVIANASLSVNGVVRLEDSLTSTNTGTAATANIIRYLDVYKVSNTRQIITTGGAITGGGTLQNDLTLVIANASLSVNGVVRLEDSLTSSNTGTAATANIVRYLDVYKVSNTRQIITTGGAITGGGTLQNDLTLVIANASTSVNGVVRLNDSLTSQNTGQALTANMGFWISSQLIGKVQNTRTISTTSPLTGGGDLTADRTLAIQAASTTQNGEVRLNDSVTSSNNFQAATANVANILARPFIGTYDGLVSNNATNNPTGNGVYLLSAAGTWVAPGGGGAGSGTVTSVTIITGSGLAQTGSTITTAGTYTIVANDASVSVNGVVRLNDTLTSTNVGQAATANIVRYLDTYKVSNTRLISTTSPLTGGGDLTADRTLSIQAASTTQNGEVRLNDTLAGQNTFQALTANMGFWIASQLVGKVQNTRTISTTSPLTGGGALSADLTLTIGAATLTTNGETRLNDTLTSLNIGQAATANIVRYLDTYKVSNTRLISTTSPLTGGGALTGDLTLTIAAATLTTNGETRLNDTLTSANIGQALTANMGRYLDAKSVPNTRQVLTSGGGVTGGGALTADITIIAANASLSVNGVVRLEDTLTSANIGTALTSNMGRYLDAKSVPNTRQVLTSGGGVTGGGALTADITIIAANASLTTNGVVRLQDSLTSQNTGQALTANMGFWISSQFVGKVQNTYTLSTTSPLTGGGDFTAPRTLAIQAASTTQNGEVRLNDTFLSQNLGQAVTANVANALARVFSLANSGLVPAPITTSGRLLRDDSTWVTVSGTGTVTSVDIITGEGLVDSGGPITGAGSITISANIFSSTANGIVPKSVTADGTKYLRDDATWQTVSAGPGGTSTFDYGTAIAVGRGYFL